jgi:hypothetical protein
MLAHVEGALMHMNFSYGGQTCTATASFHAEYLVVSFRNSFKEDRLWREYEAISLQVYQA